MKPAILISCTLLLCGCSHITTTKIEEVTPYEGHTGNGNKFTINGIDIWLTGLPNQPYTAIGELRQETWNEGLFLSKQKPEKGDYNSIALEVKKEGGDAVIIYTENYFTPNVKDPTTSYKIRGVTIKYK